jgi:hypothetical protein
VFPGSFADDFAINDNFTVSMNDKTIIIGSITKIKRDYESVSLVIKSDTSDILSTCNKTTVYNNASITDILSNAGLRFDYKFNSNVSTFSINTGETFLDILDRLAAKSNFVYYSIANKIVILRKKFTNLIPINSSFVLKENNLKTKKNNYEKYCTYSQNINSNFSYASVLSNDYTAHLASNANDAECENISNYLSDLDKERKSIIEITLPLRAGLNINPGDTVLYKSNKYYASSVKYLFDKNNLEYKICLVN